MKSVITQRQLKETRFIDQNKKKWARFEQLSKQTNYDAEELSKLYIEITDDLSYAQTKYPKRAVRVYLNSLAQNVFNSVYKKKKKKINFWEFWTKKLPLEMYDSRKNLLVSFLIFGVAMLIGIFSQEYDNEFARIILSDFYVEMTEENIANNDPLAVYKGHGALESFLMITQNNLQVALITFVMGALFSIGTFYILLTNGIMVGAFQWFFKTKGLLLASFLGIWIHGAFEISSIVIAGAAGITLGNGLLFPGTLTRAQSLVRSAKRGLRIMLGLFPFVIIAGFLESYVTRNYDTMSNGAKWFIILGSFAVMIFYFIIYPIIVRRKLGPQEIMEKAPAFEKQKKVSFTVIKSISEIVADSFYYYRKHFSTLVSPGVWLAVIILVINATLSINQYWVYLNYELYWYEIFSVVFRTDTFFSPISFLTYGIAFTLIAHNVFLKFKSPEKISWKTYLSSLPKKFVPLYFTVLTLMTVFWFFPYWSYLLIIFILPFLMYALPLVYFGKDAGYVSVWSCFSVGGAKWSNNFGLLFVIVLITAVFFQLLAGLSLFDGSVEFPDFLDTLIVPLVGDHISSLHPYFWSIMSVVKMVFFMGFLVLILPMIFINLGMGYFSVKEHQTSAGLKDDFEMFGKRSKTSENFESND